ncbi:hypothetical protein FRB99_007170 [Tulasnella sp. 403]|nr:hypothetical protein FRB99_007170 [Tulasnella sp. 403]
MDAKEQKAKGNAAFKAGDYATAVGHYSSAILSDRSDPTLPLNRAAAYLRLGKNEDAERDCTTVLSLPSGKDNVKALFRRGQARVALGLTKDAETDLREALRLEPQNDAVKAELDKLKSATTQAPSRKPHRRRVPITIVDDKPPPPPPAATQTVTKPQPVSQPSPKPRDPLETREINGKRVGGGIFRYQPTKAQDAAPDLSKKPSATIDVSSRLPPQNPPTLYDFTRTWNNLKSVEERWDLLTDLPPQSLSTTFRTSLGPQLLISVLTTFISILFNCTPSAKARILEYLRAFPSVPRFDFVIMFLTEKEQRLVEDVWKAYHTTPGKGDAAHWKA